MPRPLLDNRTRIGQHVCMLYFSNARFCRAGLWAGTLAVGLLTGHPSEAEIPNRVNDHPMLADDGDTLRASEPLVFAMIGNTRGTVAGADLAAGMSVHKNIRAQVVEDIASKATQPGGPSLLWMLGDHVRKGGAAGDWKAMDKSLAAILDGAKPPKGGPVRQLRAIPVAGDHEAESDPRYFGYGDAFPSVGADIGFGRVATWYHFDLQADDAKWRFMVVDPRREALGSRWTEQMGWVDRTLKEPQFDYLVVVMHDPVFDLGGRQPDMNRGGGSLDLIEEIEDRIGVLRLRAVVSAGHHTNQVLLPDGPRGAIHLGVGGAGSVQDNLMRWGAADEAGRAAEVNLEPLFDLALLDQLDRWNRDYGLPDTVTDEAKARGQFEGFTAAYNARQFPVAGWWEMTINGSVMVLDFHYRKLDGSFANIYRVQHQPQVGWIPSRPAK